MKEMQIEGGLLIVELMEFSNRPGVSIKKQFPKYWKGLWLDIEQAKQVAEKLAESFVSQALLVVPINGGEKSRIEVGFSPYNGTPGFTIRKWYFDSQTVDWKPTRKGVWLLPDQARFVQSALVEVLAS